MSFGTNRKQEGPHSLTPPPPPAKPPPLLPVKHSPAWNTVGPEHCARAVRKGQRPVGGLSMALGE